MLPTVVSKDALLSGNAVVGTEIMLAPLPRQSADAGVRGLGERGPPLPESEEHREAARRRPPEYELEREVLPDRRGNNSGDNLSGDKGASHANFCRRWLRVRGATDPPEDISAPCAGLEGLRPHEERLLFRGALRSGKQGSRDDDASVCDLMEESSSLPMVLLMQRVSFKSLFKPPDSFKGGKTCLACTRQQGVDVLLSAGPTRKAPLSVTELDLLRIVLPCFLPVSKHGIGSILLGRLNMCPRQTHRKRARLLTPLSAM